MNKRPVAAAAVTLAVAAALLKLGGFDPPEAGPETSKPAASDSGEAAGSPSGDAAKDAEARDEAEAKPASEEPDMASDSSKPLSLSHYPAPVDLAVDALAEALGVEPAAIDVVEVEPVTWRDGSLGCPQPGMMYTQMLTEGYRVTLEAGDEQVVYHTDRNAQVLRCESPSPGGVYESESAPTR